MQNKLDFFEVVTVCTDRPALAGVNGLEGAILGMAEEDDGSWSYGVYLLDKEEVWDFMADEVKPAGRKMKREDFYDGTSVTVTVDPETGEGALKD